MLHNAVDTAIALAAEHSLALVAGALLLTLSASFSGCETALFSLSIPEMNRVRAGRTWLDRAVSELHAGLKPLLPILLFCNMAVNIGIFSLSASLSAALFSSRGAGAALLFNLLAVFAVIFLGEVFPKQLAISSTLAVARLTAPPVWCCRRLLGRPLRALDAVTAACERLLSLHKRDHQEILGEELRLLMEFSKRDQVISDGEYELIDGVVDLPEVRVRDLMIHRVDASVLPLDATLDEALALARKCRHCKLPVLDAGRSDFSGWLDAREIFSRLLANPGEGRRRAGHLLRGFAFLSEHDRADQALERIRGGREEFFAVVDERGQIAGFLTPQDLMLLIMGGPGEGGGASLPPIRETGDGYVASGRLSVREWRDFFGVSDALPKSATLGGLVTAVLGRMARPGDSLRLGNIELTVLSSRRNRVGEVRVRLAAPATGAEAEEDGL